MTSSSQVLSRRTGRVIQAIAAGLMLFALNGCGGDGGGGIGTDPQAPVDQSGGRQPATAPFAIDSVSPQHGVPGTTVTIGGTGFTRSTRVFWGQTALAASFHAGDRLTVVLPATNAAEDVAEILRVTREDGVERRWETPVVVEAVPAPKGVNLHTAREGQRVRIDGDRMHLIRRVAMGEASATPTAVADDGSWIEFLVPVAAASGTVVAYDARDRGYPVGVLLVAGKAVVLPIADVQVSQGQLISVMQATQDPHLRLVPLRDTLVRVRLAANTEPDSAMPEVRLTVRRGASESRVFKMEGPSMLGLASVAEDDLAGSYTVTVPGEWIGPDLRLDVEANEQRFPASLSRFSYTPGVGVVTAATYVRLHVVPIAPDSGKVVSLDLDWFKAHLQAVYPLSEIDVVVEPPLAGPAANDSYKWLDAVRDLRAASQPGNHDFYFGVMPCGNCAGLAYMPGRVAVASHRWYGREDYSVQGVMMHEIGHNFGRPHSFDDKSFPYAENRLGGPWSVVVGKTGGQQFMNPATWYDVMSYSYPKTISAYTYAGAGDYLSTYAPLSARPRAEETTRSRSVTPVARGMEALYLSGQIDLASGKVRVNPPIRMTSQPDTVALAANGMLPDNAYALELTSTQGTTRYPLHMAEIGDAGQPLLAFELTIPAIDDLRAMQVRRGRLLLSTESAAQAARPPVLRTWTASRMSTARATVRNWGTLQIDGDKALLTWDARRWPWISVWQRTADGDLPLVASRSGGAASVALRAPAASTRALVISLSDGINTRLEVASFGEGGAR